jgi:hypothetical protein
MSPPLLLLDSVSEISFLPCLADRSNVDEHEVFVLADWRCALLYLSSAGFDDPPLHLVALPRPCYVKHTVLTAIKLVPACKHVSIQTSVIHHSVRVVGMHSAPFDPRQVTAY